MPRDLDGIVAELNTLLDRQRELLQGKFDEERVAEYVMGTRRIRQLLADMQGMLASERADNGATHPGDVTDSHRDKRRSRNSQKLAKGDRRNLSSASNPD